MWNRRASDDASASSGVNRYDARAERPDAADHADLSALLEKIGEARSELAATRPNYEFTAPRSFGGIPATTPYAMPNPFDTDCEVCILAITNTASQAITAILTTSQNPGGFAAGATAMTATMQGDYRFQFVVSLGPTTTVPGPDCWYPLDNGASLYATIASATTSALYFVLQFRRRTNPAGVPNFGYP